MGLRQHLAYWLILIAANAGAQTFTRSTIGITPATSDSPVGDIRFYEKRANGTNYVGFKAPDSLAGNVVWVLPNADGSSGQCLAWSSSGTLGWGSCSSGSGAPTNATYITQTADGTLSNEQALSALATGLVQVTTSTGVLSSVTSSAGIAGLISDETGSGPLVFRSAPTLDGTVTIGVGGDNTDYLAFTAMGSDPTCGSGAYFIFARSGVLKKCENTVISNLAGGITGPGSTTSGWVPTWNDTSGATLGTGYAATTTAGTANSIVLRDGDGEVAANVFNGGNFFGNLLTIESVSKGTPTASIKRFASDQTADLLRFYSESASVMSAIDVNGNFTGRAALALALNSDPLDCTTPGQFATGIAANGNLTCSTPSGSGDTLAPATNTADYFPQWDGSNSKTLKNGYPGSVSTSASSLVIRGSGGDIQGSYFIGTPGADVVTGQFLRYGSSQTSKLVSFRTETNTELSAIDKDGNFTGRAATATALASNPTDCTTGEYASAIDASGNLTCSAPSGGSKPLNEVRITDYGADTTCSTAINSAFASAYAALGTTGGVITFPPGCYAINDTLTVGDGQASSGCSYTAGVDPVLKCLSTVNSVTLRGAGTVVNAGATPGGTNTTAASEIRWTGSAPGAEKPMIKFLGPISGGGMEDLYLNANNTANVSGVYQVQHNRGSFTNVTIVQGRTAMWQMSVHNNNANAFLGQCGNVFSGLVIDKPGSGGSGMKMDGMSGGADSCSNTFIGGSWVRDGNTAGTYSLYCRFCDNNLFLRTNFFTYPTSGGTNTDGEIKFEQWSGDTSFPKENQFVGVSAGYGVTGTSGTGGNSFIAFNSDDCSVTVNCVYFSMDYLNGSTNKGYLFGYATRPPGARNYVTDASTDNSFVLIQPSGAYNSAGSLAFQRESAIQYRISAHATTGLSIWTASSGGSIAEKWRFETDGDLMPVSSGLVKIGTSSLPTSEMWTRSFNTYTSGSQSNTIQADAETNWYVDTYSGSDGGSSDTTAPRTHKRRSRCSLSSPCAIVSGDRIATDVTWGYSGGFQVGTRVDAYADTVSGVSLTTSLRFATANSGSLADRVRIDHQGVQIPAYNRTTVTGMSPSDGYIVICTDCVRDATCSSGGTGALAKRIGSTWICN